MAASGFPTTEKVADDKLAPIDHHQTRGLKGYMKSGSLGILRCHAIAVAKRIAEEEKTSKLATV